MRNVLRDLGRRGAPDDLGSADAVDHRRRLRQAERAAAIPRVGRVRLGLFRPGSLVYVSRGSAADRPLLARFRSPPRRLPFAAANCAVAHDAWALAFAVLGSILAGLIVKHSAAGELTVVEGAPSDGDRPGWWTKPVCLGILGFGLVGVALAGWRRHTDIAAGAVFLLAWALLGLAVIGAVFGAGRRREAWFGAAAFGLGYMILAFGPVVSTVLPTNHLLNAVFHPEGPRAPGDRTDDVLSDDEPSRRVTKALEAPISLHFPGNTPLKTVLEPIKERIRESLGKDPVIYVAELRIAASPRGIRGSPGDDRLRQHPGERRPCGSAWARSG